jgi:hypothetical protein
MRTRHSNWASSTRWLPAANSLTLLPCNWRPILQRSRKRSCAWGAAFMRQIDDSYRRDVANAVEDFCNVAVTHAAQEGLRALWKKERQTGEAVDSLQLRRGVRRECLLRLCCVLRVRRAIFPTIRPPRLRSKHSGTRHPQSTALLCSDLERFGAGELEQGSDYRGHPDRRSAGWTNSRSDHAVARVRRIDEIRCRRDCRLSQKSATGQPQGSGAVWIRRQAAGASNDGGLSGRQQLAAGCFVAGERVERRLAAILAVDVAGYSRLMASTSRALWRR